MSNVQISKGRQALEMIAAGVSFDAAAIRLGVSSHTLKVYISKARNPEKYACYGRDKMREYRREYRRYCVPFNADGPMPGSQRWWKARGF